MRTATVILTLLALLWLPVSAVDIAVSPLIATGPQVQRWGWDLKAFPERLDTPAEAQKLYGDVPANLVRFPIFADAHFQDGTVNEARYTTELTSLGQVVAVRPAIQIFASLKLQGVNTFPAWVQSTEDGTIFSNPAKKPLVVEYARLLADFVSFMAGKGHTVHYVGPGNETGQCLTPDRFGVVAANLKSELAIRGLPIPQIVGPCTFSLSSSGGWDNAVSFLSNVSAREQIDIVSSHFYPQHNSGSSSDWQTLATLSGGKPMWHTEIHTATGTSTDLQQVYRDALAVIFTSNLNGVNSFVHWSTGSDDNSIAALIKRHEMRTMVGSTPCGISAPAFSKGDPAGTPLYQTYYHATDGMLYLWVANPGASLLNVNVALNSGIVTGAISSLWWQGNAANLNGTNSGTQPATVAVDGRSFTATFKHHAVTVVTIPFAPASTPPVALDDAATTPQATAVDIAVLANDTDDGTPAPLFVQSIGTPQRGSVALVGNAIRYTPDSTFLGTDAFTYTVSDGAETSTATVRVAVTFSDGDFWFPFNQTSGLVTYEAGGQPATLTGFMNNPAQWVAGKSNRGLQFDGVDDFVSVDNFTGVLGTAARTCAAWVKTTSTGINRPIIAWGPNNNGSKWTFLMTTAGVIRAEITAGLVVGTRAINDGQWHHVACTFENDGTPNAADVKFYVDGTLETISTSTAFALNTAVSGNAKIGSDIQGRFWSGTMDDARIYARALSAGEIAALAATPETSSLTWHRRYLGAAVVDWLADDDDDSFPRLLEYALGGQPQWREDALYDGPIVAADRFRWNIPRRKPGTHNLTYAVEASRDLLDWTIPATLVGTAPLDAEFDVATYEAAPAISAEDRLFFRLRAVLPF